MSSELVLYDAARKALAQAKSTDEVKGIRDRAIAIRAYAQQAKDKSMEADAYEIRVRAERRLGEMMAEQRETMGMATGGQPYQSTGSQPDPVDALPTLAAAGIDKHLADAARKSAAIPGPDFEKRVEKKRATILKGVHVSHNSGNNEWYTPPAIIEAARAAMGSIDLDPASSQIANTTVAAGQFFTAKQDGLKQQWAGNVWMNPPYAQPLVDEFSMAVTEKYEAGEIRQACILVNNATETEWFQRMLRVSSAACFLLHRVKFLDPSGAAAGAPLQGQAVLYMGSNEDAFASAFASLGIVVGIL